MPELLLKKVSELSFQMHLFRSPPDTLIEDHRQVRGPLFYDSGQFAREQVLGCANAASIFQAYTRIWVEEQIAARTGAREIGRPISIFGEHIRRDDLSAKELIENTNVRSRYRFGEHWVN